MRLKSMRGDGEIPAVSSVQLSLLVEEIADMPT
jgi:hypothetical protein